MAQKLEFMLRRRPELTRERFQEIWLREHAPLVQRHMARLGCVRYVQVHTDLDAAARPDRPEPFDGVAELWFDPSRRSGTSDETRAAVQELTDDEARFIDLAQSPLWFSEERPVLERGISDRRLTYPLHRLPGMSREDFQRYWWETHGPAVKSHAGERLVRYVQVHSNPDAEALPGRARRGAPAPFDGVAILWYDETRPLRPPGEGERVGQILFEDEAKFIDHARSPLWMGREVVIIDR